MIRAARPDEAAILTRLAHTAKASWGYTPADMRGWADDLCFDAASIRTQPTFVVDEGCVVCAVIQQSQHNTPWEIGGLWVDPRAMRRGHGRALMQHVVAMARSQGQSILAIDADPHALPFYVSIGARQVGSVPAPIAGHPDRQRPQLRLDLVDAVPQGGMRRDA
jgi:GNAT superfamily N-acetyltransferase